MNTNYDTIWECFVDNAGVDYNTLPKTNDGKYILIKNGLRHYNSFVDKSEIKLKGDNLTETINVVLDDDRLLLLAFCMKYSFLENELITFEQLYQPFVRDVGQRYYRDQIKGRENTLDRTKNRINSLLGNLDDFSYLD